MNISLNGEQNGETFEASAKTVDMAISEALTRLDISRDDAEVEILDEGARGFLGIGARLARVRVKVVYDPIRIAETFIKEMSVAMGIIVKIDSGLKDRQMEITISGDNMGVLIGKRGQTLDAIQFLVGLAVNRGVQPYINVSLDAENYRARRKEILEQLALSLARKVKHTKRPVTLEPMNTFERRIIHAALQSDRYISTYSEGTDPYRNIVISPKRSYSYDERRTPRPEYKSGYNKKTAESTGDFNGSEY